jgi:hypothetical protein
MGPAQSGNERKYALTKVAASDYLLPSNDGRVIWRLAIYNQNSDLSTARGRKENFWGVWRWAGEPTGYVDTGDWSQWEMVAQTCKTRRDAINEALRLSS